MTDHDHDQLQGLIEAQLRVADVIHELHDYLQGATEPPRHEIVVLTSATPRYTSQAGATSPSLGVYNGNPFNIMLGVEGRAVVADRPFVIPAMGGAVIPIRARWVDVGANAADLAADGDAVVHLFRFHSLQPLQIWGNV